MPKFGAVLFSLILFSTAVLAGGPSVVFTTGNQNIAVGETVLVELGMDSFPESQGGGLNLMFDPRVVHVTGVVVNQSVWSFSHQTGQIDNDAGRVDDIVFAAFPGASGDGKIATIELQAIRKGNARLRLEASGKNPFSSNGEIFTVSLGRAKLHVK